MSNEILEKTALLSLLPHHGNMCLSDAVTHHDRDEIECIANNHRDITHPLRDGNRLPVQAAIEYAAQAAGVHGGLLNQQINPGAPAQMGYLAVISNLRWHIDRLDTLTDSLVINARRTAVTPGGRAYHVRISHRGTQIMEGNLIIALEIAGQHLA